MTHNSASHQSKVYYRIRPEPFSGYRSTDGNFYTRLKVDREELPINQNQNNYGAPLTPPWLDRIIDFEKAMSSFFVTGTKGLDYRTDLGAARHEVKRLILPATDNRGGPSRGKRFERDQSLVQKARETDNTDPSRLFRAGGKELMHQFCIDKKTKLNRAMESHSERYLNSSSPIIPEYEFARVRYKRLLAAVILRELGEEIFSCGRQLWNDYEDRDPRAVMKAANHFLCERQVPEHISLELAIDIVFSSGINIANYWACFSNLWDVFEICAFIAREFISRHTDRDQFYRDLYVRAATDIITSSKTDELSGLKRSIMEMVFFFFHEHEERAAGRLPPLDGVKSMLPSHLSALTLYPEGEPPIYTIEDSVYALSALAPEFGMDG